MNRNLKLSVIIPVYNEENTVLDIVAKVQDVDIPKEIIIVNDCSTDNTKKMLDTLAEKDSIKIVHHSVNSGKGAAIQTAKDYITGDLVIIQDADLEYDPAEYLSLYNLFLEKNADAVYGSRYSGNQVMIDTFVHYYGNKAITFISNIFSNLHLTDMETCYKMIRSDIFKKIDIESNCFGFEPEITAKLAKMNIRIFEVPIHYEPRIEGKKIGWRDGVKAIWFIIKFNLLSNKKK